jgi:oxygen-independent coproporphyrinogen-3 oxidase
MAETMMLGMRLTGEGVQCRAFRERFGVELADRYARELRELRELNLIEWGNNTVRLTKPARLVANRVFRAFV